MMQQVSMYEIDRDLTIVLGKPMSLQSPLAKALDKNALKKAYLKRALQVHPDRAQTLAVNPDILHSQFAQLTLSYERLSKAWDSIFEPQLNPQTKRTKLPKTYLKFAQFLYHKRIIPRDLIFVALEWQRQDSNRTKPIGQFFVGRGYIKSSELNGLLIEYFNHNKHYQF